MELAIRIIMRLLLICDILENISYDHMTNQLCCPDTRIRIPVRDTAIRGYAISPKMRIRGYVNIYIKNKKIHQN